MTTKGRGLLHTVTPRFALVICTAVLVTTSAVFIPDAFNVSVAKPFFLFSFAACVLSWSLVSSVRSGKTTISLSALDFAVILWTVAASVSFILSDYTTGGQNELLTLGAILVFYLLAAHGFDRNTLNRFFPILVSTAVAVSIYGLLELFSKNGPARLVSTLGNATNLATFVAMCVPFSLLLYLESRAVLSRVLSLCASSLLLITIVLSQTRSTWLAAAVGLPFFLPIRTEWRKILALAAMTAFFMLLVMILWPSHALVVERVTGIFAESTTLHRRIVYWGAAWNAFVSSPIIGNGFGAFQVFMPEFRNPSYWMFRAEDISEHAHNFILEILSEAGAFGLLAFIGVLGLWLFKVWRSVGADLHARAIATSVGICLIDNLFNVSLFQLPVNLLFWILIGSAIQYSGYSPIVDKQLSIRIKSRMFQLAALVLLLVFVAWQARLFYHRTQADRYAYAALLKFYLEKDHVGARSYFRQSLDHDPTHSFSLFHLGVIDYEHSDFSASLSSLRTLHLSSPFFPQSNLYRGLSYQSKGLIDSAVQYIQLEVRLSNHPRSYLALSQLYRELGDAEEERSALNNIVQFHRPSIDSTTVPYYLYALERLDSLRAFRDLPR